MNKSRNTIQKAIKKATTAGAMTMLAASMVLTSPASAFAAEADTTPVVTTTEAAQSSGVILADGSVLEEGTYSVPVTLKNAGNLANNSMAAGALKDTAKIVVAGGKAAITLSFQTIDVMTCYGNLNQLWYFDSVEDYKSADYESLAHETTVFTTRNDAKYSGFNHSNLQENLEKPEDIQFELPYTDNAYVYVLMDVDVMSDLGMTATGAAVYIDYSLADEVVDKTALSTAITEAKAITADEYTEDSFAGLTAAITAAEAVNNNEEATQKQVNAQVAALETAVKGLEEKKPVVLENGIYEVSLNLWNASADKASMADSSINGKAKIVAEDGVYKMYMYTQPMTMGTIVASLQEMKVYSEDGSYTDAVVETKDAEGNPTSFSFILPSTSEYIKVAVNPHVAMMGNMDIDARLKIDYSTLTYVSELPAETPTETPVETPADNSGNQESTGTQGGSTLQTPEVSVSVNQSENAPKMEASSENVQTGDHRQVAPFTAALAGASAVLLAGFGFKKRNKLEK